MTIHARNRIIFAVLSVILVLICTTTYQLWKYNKMVKSITVQDVTLSGIADGEYEGECDLSLVFAKVKVTMCEGRIESIAILKHENGRGKSAERIIEDVISRQKIDVNTITGATASSKAILKAVENALKGANTSD
jgi:uncharacterized protein with FMN-binding domain